MAPEDVVVSGRPLKDDKPQSTATPRPAPKPLDEDQRVDAVEKALEEGEDDARHILAERQAAGFAPPMDPGDPRHREEKEATVRKALGIGPTEHLRAAELRESFGGKGKKQEVLTDAEQTARTEADRASLSPAGTLAGGTDSRAVIINGVHVIVPTGLNVSVPGPVAEVLANAAEPLRTEQMKGGGMPTIDLRDAD